MEFFYNSRGQLLTEGTALGSTLNYEFDGNTSGSGLGVRTRAYQQNPPYEQKITQHDPWARIAKESTTHEAWRIPSITGRTTSPEVNLILNELSLETVQTTNSSWEKPVSLKPGNYKLHVLAIEGDRTIDVCEVNPAAVDKCEFTVSPRPHTHENSFDEEGNLTKTITTGPENQTKTQEYTWDTWGHLAKVTEKDHQNNGFHWSAIYDPFGSRFASTHKPLPSQ